MWFLFAAQLSQELFIFIFVFCTIYHTEFFLDVVLYVISFPYINQIVREGAQRQVCQV